MPEDEGELVMKVEFEAEIKISAIVDMVEHFSTMPEIMRPHYWDFDILETGFADEFERPVAWVADALYDESSGFGSGNVRGGRPGFDDGDMDGFWDIRVKRESSLPYRPPDRLSRWTEADFAVLVAAVPWLNPPEPPDTIDTSRMPGSMDRPLFTIPEESG